MTSNIPGVKYGAAHYKYLKQDKMHWRAFNLHEMEYHINAKEPLATKFSLNIFVKVSDDVKLLSDSTTTIHGIKNMLCNKSDLCHSVISEIWARVEVTMKTFGLLLPTFQERRTMMQMQNHVNKTELERILNQKKFTKILSKFQFQPEVDVFASRLIAQLPVSYHPDLEAMHINAFSISWQDRPFYTFPPLAVIGKVLHEIVLEVARRIIVAPNWQTQP